METLLPTAPIPKSTRLGSMLLDHIIMTFVFFLFSIPSFIETFTTPSVQRTNTDLFSFPNLLSLFGMAVYLCKDCIGGRSPAKRILSLQVVRVNTQREASPIQCFTRNIMCLLWPVEVIITLFNTSRRFGDRLAQTQVIQVPQNKVNRAPNYVQVVASVILSYGLVLLIFIPFMHMLR